MQEKLKNSFRELARRHGLSEEDTEKFVEESLELIRSFNKPEYKNQKDRDKAVRKLVRKYGLDKERR